MGKSHHLQQIIYKHYCFLLDLEITMWFLLRHMIMEDYINKIKFCKMALKLLENC